MCADHARERRRTSFARHMRHFDAGHALEHLGKELMRRVGAAFAGANAGARLASANSNSTVRRMIPAVAVLNKRALRGGHRFRRA